MFAYISKQSYVAPCNLRLTGVSRLEMLRVENRTAKMHSRLFFFFSAAVRANYYIYLFLFLLFCFERSLRYEYWGSKTTSFGNSKKKKIGQQWR